MASTSEKGHAKNVANANVLITLIQQLGTQYQPSNSSLQITNLQSIYNAANQHLNNVNNLLAPYTVAVTKREELFAPLSKKITKLRKVYKSTENVTLDQLDDFMTIARRIKGARKLKGTEQTNTETENKQHSTSQLSYTQRINNLNQLVALFKNTPTYTPNEDVYKISTLENDVQQMEAASQQVITTYAPLNSARAQRNDTMYLNDNNLVDVFNKAKDYLFAILPVNSTEYKAIGKVKFKKP